MADISLKVLISTIGKDILPQVSAQLILAHKNAETLSRTLGNVGQQLSAVGHGMTALTAPLAAGLGLAAKGAADFEAEMTKVVTLTGVAEETVRGWTERTKQIAIETGRPLNETAQALYFIAGAGVRGAEAMDVLEYSSKASAAGMGEVKDIALAVVSAMAAYGKENLNASRATDVMVATVREGNVESQALAGALGRVLPIASYLGVSLEEVGAYIATITRVGLDANESVTALRGTLAAMLDPAKQSADALAKLGVTALDLDRGRRALADLGMSFEDLRRKVKDEGLAATLVELVKATNGNSEALGAIIPNVRALTGVLGAAGQQAKTYLEINRAINASTGDTDKAFERTRETFKHTWEEFRARVDVAAEAVGSRLLPVLGRLLQEFGPKIESTLKGWAAAWDRLSPATQAFAVKAGLITLAIGPMLIALGKIVSLAGSVSAAFSTVAGVVGRAGIGEFVSGLAARLPVAVGAVTALQTAVVALGAAIGINLGTAMVDHGAKMDGSFNDPARRAVAEVGVLRGAMILLGDLLGKIGEGWKLLGGLVFDAVKGAAGAVTDYLVGSVKAYLETAPMAIAVTDALKGAWDNLGISTKWLSDQFYELGIAMYTVQPTQGAIAANMNTMATASQVAGRQITNLDEAVRVLRESNAKLLAEQQKQAAAAKDAAAQQAAADKAAGEAAAKRAAEIAKAHAAAAKAAEDAAKKFKEARDQMLAGLSGKTMGDEIKVIVSALNGLNATTANFPALRDLREHLEDLRTKGAPGAAAAIELLDSKMRAAVGGVDLLAHRSIPGLAEALKKLAPEAAKLQGFLDPAAAQAQYDAQLNTVRVEEQRAAAIKRIADEQLRLKSISKEEYDQIVGDTNKAKDATDRWGEALKALDSFFQVLGINADSTIGRALGGITGLGHAIESIAKKGGIADSIKKSFADFKLEGGGGLGGLLKIGSSIVGGIGAAIQGVQSAIAIGKAIGSLFTKSPAEKAADEAGAYVGGRVSKKLGEELVKLSKDLGVSIKTAVLLSLDKVMQDTGKTAHQLGGQIMDLMRGVANGSIPAAQGIESIGQAWSSVREEAERAGTVGDALTVQMLAQARAAGQMTDEMKTFVQGRIDSLIDGVGGMVTGYVGAQQRLVNDVAGAWEDTSGKSGTNVATIFMGAFSAAMKEKGLLGAVDALSAPFEQLRKLFEDQGNTAALALLAPFQGLMEKLSADSPARALITEVDGIDKALVGLADTGWLTREAFGAMQDEIGAAAQGMQEAGLTDQERFMALLPSLRDLASASREYGFTLDENTQSLINQAQAAGFAFPVEPMMQVVDLLASIATSLGAVLPASYSQAQAASSQFTSTATAGVVSVGAANEATAAHVSGAWNRASDTMTSRTALAFHQMETPLDGFMLANEQSAAWVSMQWSSAIGELPIKYEAMAPDIEAAFLGLADLADPALQQVHSQIGGIVSALYQIPGAATGAGEALGGLGGSIPAQGPSNNGELPRYASGGVVSTPTVGVIGDSGPGNPELVGPADALARSIGAGLAAQLNQQQAQPVHVTVNLPGNVVLRYIEMAQRAGHLRTHPDSIQDFG